MNEFVLTHRSLTDYYSITVWQHCKNVIGTITMQNAMQCDYCWFLLNRSIWLQNLIIK